MYRIAILLHEDEVLEDTRNFEAVGCTDYGNPRYFEARAIDDERCDRCARREVPPALRTLAGGATDPTPRRPALRLIRGR